LSDKPFAPGGILNADPYFANANITDTRVYNITIQHLLEHSAGWNRSLPMPQNPLPPYPWGVGHSDPIGFPLHVTQTLGEANPVTRRAMIKFSIQKGLDFAPATAHHYSNMGYLVLGEVIEKKTGMTYENYVKQNIFAPLGIDDIRLGKSLLADKQEREGEYITSPTYTTLSAYGTGQFVPWEYGGHSIEAMDAHGGWVATARDLVRLLTAVDGFPSRPDLLSPGTIQTMVTPSANNTGYATGWQLNPSFGAWQHGGSLPGTSAQMARTNGEVTWAIIFNKNPQISGFQNAITNLAWNCVNSTTAFPTHDLFDVPTQNASAMNFSDVASDSMTVSWTNGNGDGRVLVMRADGAPNRFPLDGTDYAAGAQVDLGDGNHVVYSGTVNSATVGNLNSGTNYQFRLYEYRKNSTTGNYSLYQLANPASGSRTAGTSPPPAQLLNISTRSAVESGDNVLIGGFIISGNDSKKVMVRAIGPSLPVGGRLANPRLELFDSTGTLVKANDNWQDAGNRQEMIDSTLAPADDLESAVLLTLAPGAYTAVVRGADGGAGVALVELYDLDPAAASKLANISTRGSVQTADNVMIAGTIVAGVESQNVLVRALGPSLPVSGKLGDPSLELFDGNGVLLAANNNWKDTQAAEIEATTIPPPNDLEAAIVTALSPAAYTAVVRGVGNSTGVALVEVYALD
jgi:CubicO group peptidase (beta-lactamase class C family)